MCSLDEDRNSPEPVGDDPLLAYIGAAGEDEGPTDSAEAHDHYLYAPWEQAILTTTPSE